MIISLKDSVKLVGISIVCFCAVFVCTFFLNYYLDVIPMEKDVSAELLPLYNAQLATAKFTCALTGGFLSAIAVVMLIFYIKLFVDNNAATIGIFKAMGFSNAKIAQSFLLFGISAFVGCAAGFALGWAFMPAIYRSLTIDGLPTVSPTFHAGLLVLLTIAPPLLFAAISFAYAWVSLRKPVLTLLKGQQTGKEKPKAPQKDKNRPFLKEMRLSVLKSKKMLAFFVAFSCFCFSAMVQMGLSMEDLVTGTMGVMILLIGLVLAFVSMMMSMTSLVQNNKKSIAVLKAMGFSQKERFAAVFSGYLPFAALGFFVGTAYQYGLLCFMINVVFKDVGNVPEYQFSLPVFFVTLALFVVCYAATFAIYLVKVNKVSVKEIMLET